jgi:hypothetical protein
MTEEQKQAEVTVPATFDELEEKVAPALTNNHNETLVQD